MTFGQLVRDIIAQTADDTDPIGLDDLNILDLLAEDDFSDLLQ